jgi:HD-GYP domain-containing protein (c-di-GMP phosphodiesterase class II)
VNAIDALTVKRPYREPISFEGAFEEIISSSGKIYDPAVIQAALKASGELREYIGRIVFSGTDHEHGRDAGA